MEPTRKWLLAHQVINGKAGQYCRGYLVYHIRFSEDLVFSSSNNILYYSSSSFARLPDVAGIHYGATTGKYGLVVFQVDYGTKGLNGL